MVCFNSNTWFLKKRTTCEPWESRPPTAFLSWDLVAFRAAGLQNTYRLIRGRSLFPTAWSCFRYQGSTWQPWLLWSRVCSGIIHIYTSFQYYTPTQQSPPPSSLVPSFSRSQAPLMPHSVVPPISVGGGRGNRIVYGEGKYWNRSCVELPAATKSWKEEEKTFSGAAGRTRQGYRLQ